MVLIIVVGTVVIFHVHDGNFPDLGLLLFYHRSRVFPRFRLSSGSPPLRWFSARGCDTRGEELNWAAGTDPVPASLPDPRTKAGLPLGPQCVCASRWRALAPSTHCLPDCSLGAGWQVSSMLRAPQAVVCVQTLRREMYGDPKVEFDFGSQNFSSLFLEAMA